MMKNKKFAFTLIELMVTMVLAAIVLLAFGGVLADSQRGLSQMYSRVYSPVVVDAYVARKAFDRVVRSSSTSLSAQPVITENSVKVFYYSDPNQLVPDKFAQFYVSNGTLYLDKGVKSSGTVESTQQLAENVVDVDFSVKQACLQMMLELDNGKEDLIVTSSAIRHNP